ncbi:MAG: SDR family NAD(P)-dependent oxidoreductase, partial [Gemmatimonadetes bacterium]|nr:SDR family NAD(P)-dependent oxidoreductase [Gemmatimonadota bacterium]
RSKAMAESTAAEIKALGRRATALCFDVADREACEQAITADIEMHGPYWGAVCNAGIHSDAPFPGLSGEAWDRVLRTNLDGFYNTLHPLVMPMVRGHRGGRSAWRGGVPRAVGSGRRDGGCRGGLSGTGPGCGAWGRPPRSLRSLAGSGRPLRRRNGDRGSGDRGSRGGFVGGPTITRCCEPDRACGAYSFGRCRGRDGGDAEFGSIGGFGCRVDGCLGKPAPVARGCCRIVRGRCGDAARNGVPGHDGSVRARRGGTRSWLDRRHTRFRDVVDLPAPCAGRVA